MKKSDLTKQRILEAAEAEFSEIGLHGARVDEIAARAGVNKRMLYAYFGNKEQLYTTVLTDVYNRLAQADMELLHVSASYDEMIREMVYGYFHFLSEHPTVIRMLMWENLNYAKIIRESNACAIKGRTFKMLSEAITKGVAAGVFRADMDIENMILAINMMCFSYFSNIHTMSHLLEKDLKTEIAMQSYAEQVVEMILRYLLPQNEY